ncbi:MAG: exodeoxyribonuclease VII small subunit, partial [Sphingomonadales bacterium]
MTDTPETASEFTTTPAIASLSFEAAMGELETIVRRLESGDVSLEESVTLYERGHALR